MTASQVIRVVRQGPTGATGATGAAWTLSEETLPVGTGTKTPDTANKTNGFLSVSSGGAITIALGSPGGAVAPRKYFLGISFGPGAKATTTISLSGSVTPTTIPVTGSGTALSVEFNYSPAFSTWIAVKGVDD